MALGVGGAWMFGQGIEVYALLIGIAVFIAYVLWSGEFYLAWTFKVTRRDNPVLYWSWIIGFVAVLLIFLVEVPLPPIKL